MKRFFVTFILALVFIVVFGQGKFVIISGTNVNLREMPSTNSRKLVIDEENSNEEYSSYKFDTKGTPQYFSLNAIFYCTGEQGDWRQILVIDDYENVHLAWVFAKYTKFVQPTPINSLEDYCEILSSKTIRNKGSYKGIDYLSYYDKGDTSIDLVYLDKGYVQVLGKRIGLFLYEQGNNPLIKDDFKIFHYSDRHISNPENLSLDLNKLSDGEMQEILKSVDSNLNLKDYTPVSIYYYFAPSEYFNTGRWVEVPYPHPTLNI